MQRATQKAKDGTLPVVEVPAMGTDAMGRKATDSWNNTATIVAQLRPTETTMEIERGTIIIRILNLPDATLTSQMTHLPGGPMVVDRRITTTTINQQHRKVAGGVKVMKVLRLDDSKTDTGMIQNRSRQQQVKVMMTNGRSLQPRSKSGPPKQCLSFYGMRNTLLTFSFNLDW